MTTARRRRVALFLVVAGILAGIYAVYMLTGNRMDSGDKISSIVSASAGFLSLAAGLASLVLQLRSTRSLDEIAVAVAVETARRWRAELAVRGVDRPLLTRWSTFGTGSVGGRVLEDRGAGDITEVERKWRELEHPFLVVVGAPGAGKTSLLMVLVEGLARNHGANEPVPVILDLSAWPSSDLNKWMVAAISTQWDVSKQVAAAMLDGGKVLPVLDGLDELPAERHKTAVKAVSQWSSGIRPCVVACRKSEYLKAVAAHGERMIGALIVEVQPLQVDDVAAYLRGVSMPSTRWDNVIRNCRDHPDGDLSTVLRKPLMAFLARVAYRGSSANPDDLFTFASQAKIEEHLLSVFIPEMYGDRPSSRPGPLFSVDKALAWLVPLASSSRFTSLTKSSFPVVGWYTAVLALLISAAVGWGVHQALSPVAQMAFALGVASLSGWAFTGALMGKLSWGGALIATFWMLVLIVATATWWPILGVIVSICCMSIVADASMGDASERRLMQIYTAVAAVAASIALPFVYLAVSGNRLEVLIGYGALIGAGVATIAALPVLRLFNYIVAASLGRVPPRPEEFLRDAHARGVLRKTGDGYRFRHEYLRSYIAPGESRENLGAILEEFLQSDVPGLDDERERPAGN